MKLFSALVSVLILILSQVSVFSHTGFTDFDTNPDFKINEIRQKYLKKDLEQTIVFQDFFSEQWRFPIQAPSNFFVNQGYNGQFSHQNKLALDISTPSGVVSATRSGTIGVINFGGKWDQWCNSYNDCLNKGGIWNGNHIVINHPNGTSSFYIHLKSNSLMPGLFVGKQVNIGTPLGIIGGTGFTCNLSCTAPFDHLHFQVNSGANTIPTPFEDCLVTTNNCIDQIPQAGSQYQSINFPPKDSLSTGPIYLFGQNKTIDQNLQISSSRSNWLFSPTGELKINNLCLTDSGNLGLSNCNENTNQSWAPTSSFGIKNIQTNRCLSRNDDNLGQTIFVQACNNSPTQQFRHASQPIIFKTI